MHSVESNLGPAPVERGSELTHRVRGGSGVRIDARSFVDAHGAVDDDVDEDYALDEDGNCTSANEDDPSEELVVICLCSYGQQWYPTSSNVFEWGVP